MKEIAITEIEGIRIGHAQDLDAVTGCTVLMGRQGMTAGVDVRGSAPGFFRSALGYRIIIPLSTVVRRTSSVTSRARRTRQCRARAHGGPCCLRQSAGC